MSFAAKADIVQQMEDQTGRKSQALLALGVARSSYYRWRHRNESKSKTRPWNRITPNEEHRILAVAREFPELSSRQISVWITDNEGFAVSESTVYRILHREGLVKRLEFETPAAKEYHTKTSRPHQMWSTDCSYFKVPGWGYYYLVTVMDDYSRFILSWKLQTDMAADSLIEVVQQAIDATGMTEVPVVNRTRLLSDNGSGYISRAFNDYLHLVGIDHIRSAPYHPQTNGKIERYQQSLKKQVNQLTYTFPGELDKAIMEFVDYYNYHRYHIALGNVTPADVLNGKRKEILQRRKEMQIATISNRRNYNHGLKELATTTLAVPKSPV
jgi:putative transposase